ncbi:MAG: DNRLRE domain-containing protein, partial [Clostridia bacterium]|nr:DNRLRE domain-containing protein [Clostridia bacterium]
MKDKRSLLAFFTRNRVWTRILSLLLSLVMLFYVIPSVVYGEIAEAFSSIGTEKQEPVSDAENDPSSLTYEKALFEVEELREESVKHFHLEDGSYVASQYGYPVHYENADGELVDIDNSLYSNGTAFSNPNARIKFSKKINGSASLFTLHDGNTKLEMSLVGANKGVAGVVTNGVDNESDTELQKMMNLEKLSASILYENVLDGVDLEYIAYSMNIKDNIIVKEKKNEYTYSFELKLNNLWARRESNGDISIFEGKGDVTDPLKYTIPAPVVYDANGEYAPADKAQYFLTHNNGGKYTLTVIVDSEWMNAEERAFPVVADPEVVTKAADAVDAWIYLDYGEAYKRNSSNYTLSQCERIYWMSTLPELPEGVYVSSAIWDFGYSNYTSQDENVKAYKVTSSWAEYEQFCYYDYTNSNIGAYDSDVLDMVTLKNGTNSRASLNITEAVNDWIAGDNNYGIMLAGYNCDCGSPISISGSASINAPELKIQYVLQTGIENYWSYSSHSIGSVATGRVNLATGDLSLVIPTLTSTPELFKYTPTLIYNSAFYDTEINSSSTNSPYASSILPRGFKLNIEETVVKKTYVDSEGLTKIYYIYCDADGTEHAFYEFTPELSTEAEQTEYESKYYADEDGLQKVLEIRTYENETDNKLLIYDDSKQVSEFTKINQNSTEEGEAWKIKSIYDISGNIIRFVYNPSNENQLTSIYLIPVVGNSVIELLGFYYNAHGKLTYIFEPNGQKAIKLLYTDDGINVLEVATKYLSQIQYLYVDSSAEIDYEDWDAHLDGRQNNDNIQAIDLMYIRYKTSYPDSGQIDFVMDALDKEQYTYSWGLFSPAINHRVSSVKQSAVNVEGQTTGFFYSTLHTEVISSGADDIYDTSDDLVTRYVFDDRGRAISVYSHCVNDMTILGASYGEYEEQDIVKNNLKEQAVLGGNPVNKFYYGTCSFLNSDLYPYIGNVTCVEGPGCEDGDKCWKFNPTPENSVARLYHCVYLP